MPRFKIVIDNPKVAHEKEVERNVRANMQAHGVDRMAPVDAERAVNKIHSRVREMIGPQRAAGTVHDVCDSECPEGLPNCRNCGDPDHAASCRAAGHCPDCGTKHGIAPDRIVAASGYRIEAE